MTQKRRLIALHNIHLSFCWNMCIMYFYLRCFLSLLALNASLKKICLRHLPSL